MRKLNLFMAMAFAALAASSAMAASEQGGESRASSPIKDLEEAPGHATFGVGPGFGGGMNSDNVMYSFAGGYVWDVDPRFAVKAIGEADIGSGRDVSRFMDVAIGADAYLTREDFLKTAKPYVTADLGVGSARNANDDSATGVTLGAGAGLRFSSRLKQQLDLQAHFKVLTAQLASTTPSVFGVRASVNF